MNSKHKQIDLFIKTTKKVSDVAVTLCFSCDGSPSYLKNLKSLLPAEDYKGSDETAILYGMFQCAENKVKGTPLDINRTRVSTIDCSVVDGHFVIFWNCHGSLTYVRKSTNIILKCMVPMYSSYEKNMKSIGLRPSREVFNKCANDISKCLKQAVHIAVVGKINIDRKVDGKAVPAQKTLDSLTSALSVPEQKKLTPESSSGKPAPPEAEFPSVSCSGIDAVLTALYITQISRIPVSLEKKKIIVHNSSWDTQRSKLKDQSKIEAYINAKYKHKSLNDHINALFAYQASTSGMATSLSVKQAATQPITTKSLVEKIKKCL